MALTPCPGCSADIPDNARVCERCGARPIRMPGPLMSVGPILHGVALGAAVLTVLGSVGLLVFGVFLTP